MVVVVAGAAALSLSLLAPSAARPAHADSSPITFATPTVVDPVNLFGEPDLRYDPGSPGVAYSSGPWGTGTQRSIWDRSLDGGHTFRELHNGPANDPLHEGGSLHGPGGGDTEIAVDHTGKLYGADLAALATQHVFVSDDRGKTIRDNSAPDVFVDPNKLDGTDRQWFGLWDPPDPSHVQSAYTGPFPVNDMVYLAAIDGNSSDGEVVASSVPTVSGGKVDSSQVGYNYACAPGQQGTDSCPTWPLNGDGYVVLDQLTGKVIQAIDAAAANGDDQAAVEIITRQANGYMDPKSPTKVVIADIGDPRGHDASTGAIFPVLTEDAQRNLYYVWVERPHDDSAPRKSSWQVFYSWAAPGADNSWSRWSAPIQITAPSSDPHGSSTAIMPWAVAGGNGNLDIAWYGTNSIIANPESESTAGAADWYLWFANVQQAASSSPQVVTERAVDHPMHHGSICLSGLDCITIQGNRNLADFFEIVADPGGAAEIVYDNTANDLVQQTPVTQQPLPEGVVDHRGAGLVQVVRQVSGTGLNGLPVNGADDHGLDSINSTSKDALYPPVNGTYYPGLDVTATSLKAKNASTLEATISLADPTAIASAAQATGAAAVDLVVRWEYKSRLYFATVEVPASGTPAIAFDGASESIDLCSVSACDPHVMTYPGPAVAPSTSHLIGSTYALPSSGPLVIDIPRVDVGRPQDGDHLDSVAAYSFLAVQSANLPISNAQAQDDQVPVEVGGACCFTPTLGAPAPSVPEAGSVVMLLLGGAVVVGAGARRRQRRGEEPTR